MALWAFGGRAGAAPRGAETRGTPRNPPFATRTSLVETLGVRGLHFRTQRGLHVWGGARGVRCSHVYGSPTSRVWDRNMKTKGHMKTLRKTRGQLAVQFPQPLGSWGRCSCRHGKPWFLFAKSPVTTRAEPLLQHRSSHPAATVLHE